MTDEIPQAWIETAAAAIEIARCEEGARHSADLAIIAIAAVLPLIREQVGKECAEAQMVANYNSVRGGSDDPNKTPD